MCIYMCVCVCVCISMRVCVYVYVCVCIYVYIYMYMYVEYHTVHYSTHHYIHHRYVFTMLNNISTSKYWQWVAKTACFFLNAVGHGGRAKDYLWCSMGLGNVVVETAFSKYFMRIPSVKTFNVCI